MSSIEAKRISLQYNSKGKIAKNKVKPITKTEFILWYIRANSQGTYVGEKARLLFKWLVENGFIIEKEEVS